MKISNLAAIFAPTLLQSPDGDGVNLKDVMLQMKCVDTLLKLEEDTWEDASAAVMTANRRTHASPPVARRSEDGGGDSDMLTIQKPDQWQMMHAEQNRENASGVGTAGELVAAVTSERTVNPMAGGARPHCCRHLLTRRLPAHHLSQSYARQPSGGS